MIREFKVTGEHKCCMCAEVKLAFKGFIDDESCGYRGRNKKPAYWCEVCWNAEAQSIADARAAQDEEIEAILAAASSGEPQVDDSPDRVEPDYCERF